MKRTSTRAAVLSAAVATASVLLASSAASAQLAHRYSFIGGSLTDSVGGLGAANAGAVTFSDDRAVFNGTANSYLTLTSGILPTTDISATVETWGGVDANTGIWSRIYDLGQGQTDYLFLTARGNSTGAQQIRSIIKRNNAAEQGYTSGNQDTRLLSTGGTVDHHTATVVDTTNDTLTFYVDGYAVATVANVTHTFAGMPQNQNYLGKGQYPDPILTGNIDEFRSYFSALTAADVLASFGAGPDNVASTTLFNFNVANGSLIAGGSYAGAAAPGSLDRATIANGGSATLAGGNASINQLRLTNGTVTVSGGATLNLAGGVDFNPAAGQTATLNVNNSTLNTVGFLGTTTGTRQINLNASTLNLAIGSNATVGGGVPIALTGNNTISVANLQGVVGFNPIATLNGVISGSGGITKTNTGVLQLSAANTFDGVVDIQAGQILTANPAALGSTVGGTIVRSGASIRNNGNRTLAENFELNGGQFQIGGATQTVLTGNILVSSDYGDLATPALVADGGSSYNIFGNVTSGGADRTFILGASGGNSVIRGSLDMGANGFVYVTGGGAWALANNSNNFAEIDIPAGNTLRIGAGNVPEGMLAGPTIAGSVTGALPANALVAVIDATSAVEFSRSDNITVANAIIGSGLVRKTNTGTLTLTGANAFSGGLVVDAGTVIVDPANYQASFGNSAQTANLVNAQGAVAVPAGTGIVASGIFSKINNTSTGAIALTENSSEALDFSGLGLVGLHLGAVRGGDYIYSGTITPSAATYRFGGGGGNLTVASDLTAGSVVEIAGQGTVRLTGNNTYTGLTNVTNSGTLVINGREELDASSGLSVTGAGTISFTAGASGTTDLTAAGKTLNLNNAQIDTNGNTITFSNAVTTSGGYVTKVGTGTLVFANTSGATNTLNPANLFVRRGTLVLNNNTLITTTAYSSVGQGAGDDGTLTLNNASKLVVNGDFNVGDVGGSADPAFNTAGAKGTLNINDTATLSVTTLYVGKNGTGAQATSGVVNMTGGTVTDISGGGDWRIGGNGDAGQATSTGTWNQSGGTFGVASNFQIGASGIGTYKLTGGTVNQTAGFLSIGRFATGVGVLDMSSGNGTYNLSANRVIIGEAGTGTILVGGNSTLNLLGIEVGRGVSGLMTQTGGAVNITSTTGYGLSGSATGGTATSTYNLSGGLLNMNGTDVLATLQNFNFTGGELRNVRNFNKPLTQTGTTSLLTVNGTTDATIAGNYSLTGGTANVIAGRAINVAGAFTLSGNAKVTGGGTLTATGATAAYNLNSGSISASLGGAGAVNVVKETIGTVTLTGAGAIDPVAVSGSGVTDLKNGKLVLAYGTGGTSPAATIVAQLDAGFDAGFTTGKIRSSTAAASRGIGYLDDVAAGTFTIAATLYGDTDLDLDVDFADLLSLAKNYNSTNATWSKGDFDYTGTVAFGDLLALAKNYNGKITGPAAAVELAGFSADFQADFALAQSLVPEPTMLGGLMAGGLTLLARRRKA